MRSMFNIIGSVGAAALLGLTLVLAGCSVEQTQETRDARAVERQQSQYAKAQPVPAYDWSLERQLAIELYNIRNARVATHSVWRSITGEIEGDCPSMGFGLPYDTSLTNPLRTTDEDYEGYDKQGALATIGQPEPNGIFASTNTSATWVFCVSETGQMEPHYIETKVTAYPYAVEVDYISNRVRRVGTESISIDVGR